MTHAFLFAIENENVLVKSPPSIKPVGDVPSGF